MLFIEIGLTKDSEKLFHKFIQTNDDGFENCMLKIKKDFTGFLQNSKNNIPEYLSSVFIENIELFDTTQWNMENGYDNGNRYVFTIKLIELDINKNESGLMEIIELV